jgi:tetratricopeptide (TPR) repeat protein
LELHSRISGSVKENSINTLVMKAITLKVAVAAILITLFQGVNAQKGIETGTMYGKGEDSIRCIMNLSLYIEFYRHKNYSDAIGPWRIVFNECPASRESLHAYGIEMYREFLEKEKDPVKAGAYCDTIMMIHDQRIKYFGGEGSVLGRKGVDLLRYRRQDGAEYVKEGYEYLKRSIELEGDKSSPVVITTFMSASISLLMNSLLSNEQVINDYVMASNILDGQLSKRADSRTKMAKEAVDSNIKESGAMTCENIILVFGPKFPQESTNKEFLLKLTEFLTIAQCENEELYANASVKLYEIEPSAEAAYNLARLFLRKEDYKSASEFYQEAIENSVNPDDKANYYYELALLNFQYLKSYPLAVQYATEATKLRPEWGDPYILIGTSYLSGRSDYSDNFEQQAVFWIAVDMFQRALSVDSSAADRALSLIRDYSSYFPTLEDLFFRSIKEGDPYLVKGWINRTTTARARK